MNQDEQDQLSDIHEEVQGSHAQLGAINERTRNIERQLESVAENVADNEEDINELEGKVKRNTTILSAVGTGLSAGLLWFADKVSRIV